MIEAMTRDNSLSARIARGEADPISDREREQLEELRQGFIKKFGYDPDEWLPRALNRNHQERRDRLTRAIKNLLEREEPMTHEDDNWSADVTIDPYMQIALDEKKLREAQRKVTQAIPTEEVSIDTVLKQVAYDQQVYLSQLLEERSHVHVQMGFLQNQLAELDDMVEEQRKVIKRARMGSKARKRSSWRENILQKLSGRR
jgi:hypothetical protein